MTAKAGQPTILCIDKYCKFCLTSHMACFYSWLCNENIGQIKDDISVYFYKMCLHATFYHD